MSTTSKSPRKVIEVAFSVAQQSLHEYSHKFSPRTFTQHQLLAAIAISCVVGLIAISVFVSSDRSLDPLNSIPAHSIPNDWSDHIKVGIVGDSWVSDQQIDEGIVAALPALGVPFEVVSSSHPGAKTRQIYRNLIDTDQHNPRSSNQILMDQKLDYLVIVAGVNDTGGHIGKEFYAHHMWNIIQTALRRGIHPVIVEVPEYGIEAVPAVGFLSWAKRGMYQTLFDDGKADVISDYREALRERIASSVENEITFFNFSSFIEDYETKTDLYRNPSHLTNSGYQQLGMLIGKQIARTHTNRMQAEPVALRVGHGHPTQKR